MSVYYNNTLLNMSVTTPDFLVNMFFLKAHDITQNMKQQTIHNGLYITSDLKSTKRNVAFLQKIESLNR